MGPVMLRECSVKRGVLGDVFKTYNIIYHTFQYVKVSNSMTIHFRKWYEKVTVACLFFGKEIWDRVPPLFFFFLLFNQCKFIILTAFICVLLFCALLSLWFSGSHHHHHLRVTSLHIFINYLTAAFLNDPQLYVSCVGRWWAFTNIGHTLTSWSTVL